MSHILEENDDIYSTHKSCSQCGYLYIGSGYFDETGKPEMAIHAESEISEKIKSVAMLLQIERILARAQRTYLPEEATSRVSASCVRETKTSVNAAAVLV